MLNFTFITLFFAAIAQISTQSPIQDAPSKNEFGLQESEASIEPFQQTTSTSTKTPITGLTTTVTTTKSINGRDGLEQDIHTTEHPATTGTLTPPSITASLTDAASSAVPTKNLKNCNVEGIPSSYLVSNILDLLYARDAYSCQLQCMYISRCEAYSWQMPVSTASNNCVFYSTLIDGDKKVKASTISGIFFSDKYPSDNSNFCYGSAPL